MTAHAAAYGVSVHAPWDPSRYMVLASMRPEVSTRNDKLLHAGEDIPAFLQANLDWHVSVVRASHNELLIAFIAAISSSVYAATDLAGFNSADVRHAVGVAHQRVMDAIEARNADSAARRMGRHVGAYSEQVEAAAADKVELEVTRVPQR